ncbi:MAG: MFS transporter [Candidatus Micrarchaeaceae archaeon]
MVKDGKGFNFLVYSRALRSVAIIYMTLAAPLYLNQMNISLPDIGLIYVAVMVFAGIVNITLGMLGDRFGYKKALIIGEVFPIVGGVILGFSGSVSLIIVAIVIGGIGGVAGGLRGTFTPGTTALVASNYPDDRERVKRISMLARTASAASIIGALMLVWQSYLSGYFGIEAAYRILFAFAAFLIFLSFISVQFVKESKRPGKTTSIMKTSSRDYTLKVVSTNILNGAAIGISMPLLPLMLGLAFHIPAESLGFAIGFIYIPSYIGVTLGSYLAGRLSGRGNIVYIASCARILSGATLMLMGVFVGFAFFGMFTFLPLLLIVTGIYALRSVIGGFGSPSVNAINIRGIHNEDYGTASSIQGMAMSTSMASSGFSGYLIEYLLPAPLFVGGVIQIIGGMLYLRLFRKREVSAAE